MKNTFIGMTLMLLLVYFNANAFGQGKSCSNLNSFLGGKSLSQLKTFADTIYTDGTIKLDLNNSASLSSIEDLHPYLDVGPQTTFVKVKETASLLEEGKSYWRFQQYHNGVKVEGAGYNVGVLTSVNDGPSPSPCAQFFLLAPQIVSGIDIGVNPKVQKSEVPTIIRNREGKAIKGRDFWSKSELVVAAGLEGDCSYSLAWKTQYRSDKNHISWIDANSGKVLKTIDLDKRIQAPTEDYGPQNMMAQTIQNVSYLQSPLLDVYTYNLGGKIYYEVLPEDYDANLIPQTVYHNWTDQIAPPSVYQAHYTVTNSLLMFRTLGIDLGTIHVGANCVGENAAVMGYSTPEDSYIVFGRDNDNRETYAVIDVAGHELGHVYLDRFLDYDRPSNSSLHEGIADMLGTYVEYKIKGAIDWKMGDDIPRVVRDLENPQYPCFDQVEDFVQQHDRSVPLGHWFYQMVEGGASRGVPAISIYRSLQIVLDALNLVGRNADYEELRSATVLVTDEAFGICSDEALAIRKAWDEICVGPDMSGFTGCNFTISNPGNICEENPRFNLCIEGAYPDITDFRWTIIGPNSVSWEASGNQQGNGVDGGRCLNILDLPDYPYYPQYFTIRVFSPTLGTQYIQERQVSISDCNGDNPGCSDLY